MSSPFFPTLSSLRRLLGLVVLVLVVVLGPFAGRSLYLSLQWKQDMEGVIGYPPSFALDRLWRLGDGARDEGMGKYLSGIPIPPEVTARLRKTFFSPFLIRETCRDLDMPEDPIGSETVQSLWKGIPDSERVSERLLGHVASFAKIIPRHFPATAALVFASSSVPFAALLDETQFLYLTGRALAEDRRGDEAFRIFAGIVDLVQAYENDRLSFPDKERRLNSCILREIAAVGMLESCIQAGTSKAFCRDFLERLRIWDSSFVPISQVLAFDRRIPSALASRLQEEIATGKAKGKYGRDPSILAWALGDATAVEADLDVLSRPLVEALAQPYPVAQRAFNPWNRSRSEFLCETSEPEDEILGWINLLRPGYFLRRLMLAKVTENLPFYALIDIKTRQLFNGVGAALAVNSYHAEIGSWPATLGMLEQWLGASAPVDLIRGVPLQFIPGAPPRLFSVGRDGKPNTPDDLIFLPFGEKAEE